MVSRPGPSFVDVAMIRLRLRRTGGVDIVS
jgi:hypothetical protein